MDEQNRVALIQTAFNSLDANILGIKNNISQMSKINAGEIQRFNKSLLLVRSSNDQYRGNVSRELGNLHERVAVLHRNLSEHIGESR